MKLVIAGGTGTVGRHVVAAAAARGHQVVTLSRRSGHDLTAGTGLREAMTGADAVIDVTSVLTLAAKPSIRFFETVTRALSDAERQAGVGHHVALSIVGIDGVDAGYYAGKLARRRILELSLPGRYWRAARSGVLRGTADAPRGTITFDDWLESPDHTRQR
ncbi:NAD-dependent epimerase/dehydratase family protein [Gryllotalpicola ginsengisoli]|uniref:NAD-dependent epimerase/dehydratase family protein n=1 Tax=Gryllotalpicola ginsengisoli TaxID=444608 RepID=UPI000408805B|nr:NAD-dependent epimerase/dehydratase family protein [Gryllotalpicola ginsengisoli]